MDDLTQKLQALLSDPESMRNLAELAAMLKEPDPAAPPAAPCAPDSNTESAENTPPPMDFTKLIAVGQALSSVQQDETAALILALRPHLSPERAKRADQAVRLLKLYAAAGILRENGLLNDFLNAS